MLPTRVACVMGFVSLLHCHSLAERARIFTSSASGFRLQARVAEVLPAGGPCPIELTLSREAERVVEAGSLWTLLSPQRMSWRAPATWKRWREPAPRSLTFIGGGPTYVRICKGASAMRIAYLHNLFRGIGPGEVKLKLSIVFGVFQPGAAPTKSFFTVDEVLKGKHLETQGEEVRLDLLLVFRLREEGQEAVAKRLRSIVAAIDAADDFGRYKRWRSILGIDHPDNIQVLLKLLRARVRRVSGGYWRDLREAAQFRLIELCEAHGRREEILDHIAHGNGRDDIGLFGAWDRYGIRLTPAEVRGLMSASSPYVQLYCLEHLTDWQATDLTYAILTNEIKDLQKRLDRALRMRKRTK